MNSSLWLEVRRTICNSRQRAVMTCRAVRSHLSYQTTYQTFPPPLFRSQTSKMVASMTLRYRRQQATLVPATQSTHSLVLKDVVVSHPVVRVLPLRNQALNLVLVLRASFAHCHTVSSTIGKIAQPVVCGPKRLARSVRGGCEM